LDPERPDARDWFCVRQHTILWSNEGPWIRECQHRDDIIQYMDEDLLDGLEDDEV